MANLSFDFNKIKRTFFNVKLKDGRKLQVKMPMKKTFEKVAEMQNFSEEVNIDDAMDTLGALCAECLSHNMNGEKVTTQDITDNYDIEEMQAFINEYYNFVGGVTDNPN
ncbi:MAG: hypothetical protein HDQ97_08970 [Lachnospiraceae bacterium]|nr:hypothetical protein [Lachnospiraceae bacterium]